MIIKKSTNNMQYIKGITLISLVITIVILLILAGITISSLTGENGLITRAKEATTEYKKAQSKEELEIKIQNLKIDIVQNQERTATLEDFNELIEEDVDLTFVSASYKIEPAGEFEKIKVLYNTYIFTVNSELVITDIQEDNGDADVDFSYEIKSVTQQDETVKYTCVLKFSSYEKITKVEYGEQILKLDTGMEEIAIDFEAEKGTEYIFKITTAESKEVEKKLIIDKEIMTEIELNKSKMYLGLGKEETLQLNILPENSYYKSIKWTSSSTTLVTVDDSGKVVANTTKEGTATITVTVQDGINSYSATCEVIVIDDIERAGYIIDITGIQSGNCVAINEIEFYNSNDELLAEHYDASGNRSTSAFSNFNLEVYDSRTKTVPSYWNDGNGYWRKLALFDGNISYGVRTTTAFITYGTGNDWARLFIYDLSEEVDHIKIYSGSCSSSTGRYPVELSVYQLNGYKTQIVNENLQTKDNDANMTLWSTQAVSTDTSAIAENTFTKPE